MTMQIIKGLGPNNSRPCVHTSGSDLAKVSCCSWSRFESSVAPVIDALHLTYAPMDVNELQTGISGFGFEYPIAVRILKLRVQGEAIYLHFCN